MHGRSGLLALLCVPLCGGEEQPWLAGVTTHSQDAHFRGTHSDLLSQGVLFS